MSDDKKHLPRPQKNKTKQELRVTGSKKLKPPAGEPKKVLGEDEDGMLKDGEVPAHIPLGDIVEITSKGPKPDHNVMGKPPAKDRADLKQDEPKKRKCQSRPSGHRPGTPCKRRLEQARKLQNFIRFDNEA